MRQGTNKNPPFRRGNGGCCCVTGGEWVDEENYFGDKTHYRRLLETYIFYDGQTEVMKLTEGLPEMKTIKKKDFEDTTVGYY